MSETLRNLLVLLAILALAGIGWFMFEQNRQLQLQMTGSPDQNIQLETQQFIQQQRRLQALSMDSQLFSDTNFLNLYSITSPVPTFPTGRANPFLPSF